MLMPEAMYVAIAAGKHRKLSVFLSLDLEVDLFRLRAQGPFKLVMIEAFATVRQAYNRRAELEKLSKKALKALVTERNPGWTELLPEPVLPSGRSFDPDDYFDDELDRVERWMEDEDSDGGGLGVRVPRGPLPLVGAAAQAIPVEEYWPDRVGAMLN